MIFHYGWTKAVLTYQCRWCDRIETIIYEKKTNHSQLENWRSYDRSEGCKMDLCSSDCEKERDTAMNTAFSNLEPVPGGQSWPVGYHEEMERLRLIVMKERGL